MIDREIEFLDDIERVLFCPGDFRDKVILRLGILGGLTISEMQNIKIVDIDFNNFRIKVNRTKKARFIHFDGYTFYLIRLYMEKERMEDSEFLLLSKRGGRMDLRNIQYIIEKNRDLVGWNISQTMLRRAAVVQWYNSGVDMGVILCRMGVQDTPKARHLIKEIVEDMLS